MSAAYDTEADYADYSDAYWATLPGGELLDHLGVKVDRYHEFLSTTGLREIWERSHKMYQWGIRQNIIAAAGEEEEYESIVVNHQRSIARHIYVGTTSARPAWQPRAINTDYRSRVQVRLCEGVLDYYVVEERGEQKQNRAAEIALLAGESYLWPFWDPNAGRIVDVVEPEMMQQQPLDQELDEDAAAWAEENQQPQKPRPIFEGDIRVENIHPIDVIRDCTRTTWDGTQWVIVRRRVNRYDLAALYPEKAADILAAPLEDDLTWDYRAIRLLGDDNAHSEDSDDVCVYYFLHDRTPAVPLGRFFVYVSPDVELEDASFEEKQLTSLEETLLRCSGGEVEGIPFGYTMLYDTMALNDAINIAHSVAMTNMANFGVTNLTGPPSASAQLSKLAKGLNYITFEGPRDGKIEVLELLSIPDSLVAMAEMWERAMETLSGVNSVTRGNPEASLKSGTALALVQSQFLEFTRDFQQAYSHLWEEFGSSIIRLFRRHVDEPRAAAIVGKGNRAYVQELTGQDLDQIDRVVVEMGSHLARTAAGRVNLAEQLQAAGYVQTPEQYMAVLETGRLEPITHHQMAELDLIQAENEQLLALAQAQPMQQPQPGAMGMEPMQPELPVVVGTDNHVLHIKEHHALTCDPEVRRNGAAITGILAHILEHENALMSMDPILAALLGQPALGMPPQGEPAAAGGRPSASKPPPKRAGSEKPGQSVTLPAVNPATGQLATVSPANDPRGGEFSVEGNAA